MDFTDIAKREVEDLIELGDSIVLSTSRADRGMDVSQQASSVAWMARTGELLQRLYPPESHHRKTFERVVERYDFTNMHSNYFSHGTHVLGILNSVRHELENGLIRDFKTLVEAGVFADFLEMAEYLLGEGYKDAAAVLIGGVLEDALRKLAERHGIETSKPSGAPISIDPLNSALAKAGVYRKLIQKQVTSWANLRNDAAHGNYDAYSREQVQMMLLFVQGFTAEYMQ